MNEVHEHIRMVPIAAITILNPRSRNKKIFQELVSSIAALGLKKPITVTATGLDTYNLVCGQGRLEAFIALGKSEIPAIVIEASKEDCYLMSLTENMARRTHTSLELMRAIGTLKERGYSVGQIAQKTDFSLEYVSAICSLLENGEERLVTAVDRGVLPPTIAIEISRAKDGDVRQALADAYERGEIPGNRVLAIRKIIDQRNSIGKGMSSVTSPQKQTKKVTADALVRAYRKETQRQAVLVKKASLVQNQLRFIVSALKILLEEEQFVVLLRSESLDSMPRPLAQRFANVGD